MTTTPRPTVARTGLRTSLLAVALVGLLSAPASMQRPRFYPDDPIGRVPETQDASKAAAYQQPDMYEMVRNLFSNPRYEPTGVRARNLNTIDEVPDSSWFVDRIGRRPIGADELFRGPLVDPPPDPSTWTLVREKTAGAHPGFTARDGRGDTYFLEFDPPYFPEGATGAVSIATKIFWALGYNQVQSYLTTFDPRHIAFEPTATLKRPNGERTPFTRDDVNEILERVHRNPDGTYRVIAGRLLPGRVLGPFRYEGTRPDDPNDIVPHEHRRELRALRVFGAWTNLTDWKDANTLDTVVTENGRSIVRHYLQDVGSTFGMCNDLHEWDLSYEHFIERNSSLKRLFSFGFALSPWQTVDYGEFPAIGKFEGREFEPRKWRPQTPTIAYMEMRDDDAFWAARRVAAFSDELIRAVVKAGQYSDPTAEKYLADVLIERRDKIAAEYLPAVNPVVSPRLGVDGRLTFANAAVDAGVARAPEGYRAAWAVFDNTANTTRPIADTSGPTTSLPAPAGLPAAVGSYVAVDLSADSAEHPAWKQPVHLHFRRDAGGWTLVGLQRLPDVAPAAGYTGRPTLPRSTR
ncbi:MAG: hypothetical protein AB7O28_00155 [Vicinamibacterales bacterium]